MSFQRIQYFRACYRRGHTSDIKAIGGSLPPLTTECVKLSSNAKIFPSSQVRVSLPTVIKASLETFNPIWSRILVFVGPWWGLISVPGCSTEIFVAPFTWLTISGICSIIDRQNITIFLKLSSQMIQV